jgi:4-hydroxy-3-polyprenylbenzoate decarboxylase
MKILLGISGASGAVYGVRAGSALLAAGAELHLLVTRTAWEIMAGELAGTPPPASHPARKQWIARLLPASPGKCRLHPEDDFRIPFASGSNPPDAVIIAPCSMGMLGRIAHGVSTSVLERCADVALKEKKPLVLVPREMPLSSIHLENMLALSRAGAEILPAPVRDSTTDPPPWRRWSISWFPDSLPGGVGHALYPRWGEAAEEEDEAGKIKMRRAEPLRRLRRNR